MDWGKKCFPSTTRCEIFLCAMLSLFSAMIWFIRLVDLPILSCLCENFALSSEFKNYLLNLQKIFDYWVSVSIINKSRRLNAKQISEVGSFEHINRGRVKCCSHIIPTEDYTEGLKALETTGNGNCLYNSASVLIQGDESANLVLKHQ